jgi:hypothetical protein
MATWRAVSSVRFQILLGALLALLYKQVAHPKICGRKQTTLVKKTKNYIMLNIIIFLVVSTKWGGGLALNESFLL